MWTTPRTWVSSELVTASVMNTHIRDMFSHWGRGARVYNSSAVSVPTGTLTTIPFNSEHYDTGGFHDNVTNNSRLTVPANMGGGYLIGFNAQYDDPVPGWIGIKDVSGNILALQGGIDAQWLTVMTYNAISSGNWVECVAAHDDGVTRNLQASSHFSPQFWIAPAGGPAGVS